MERALRILTNTAFLVLCIVGIAVGLKALRAPTVPPPDQQVSRPEPPPVPPVYRPGERVVLDQVDFSQTERTLLLAVRKGCRFCEESMSFYRALGVNPKIARNTRLVFAAPDDEAVTRAELAKHGVRGDQIVRTVPRQLRIRGTPTAIVVNRSGAVERIWSGRLSTDEEQDLLRAITAAR